MKTLIAYASKYGCTEKCAKLLEKELNGDVTLLNLKKNSSADLNAYDNIIIGGAIYISKIQKEVTEFCKSNLDGLSQKNIGLFICGMQEKEVIATELNSNYPPELLEIAVAKDCFGGEFILEKMNFLEKTIVKKVSKTTASKSEIDEDAIRHFAQKFNNL
ncbi:MAG: flavodoxin domain-containing protein [Dethiosulfatibacter sp.]|nr:flavodoxin domain-containing protein [Dethiosulfatibacter sp.]